MEQSQIFLTDADRREIHPIDQKMRRVIYYEK